MFPVKWKEELSLSGKYGILLCLGSAVVKWKWGEIGH